MDRTTVSAVTIRRGPRRPDQHLLDYGDPHRADVTAWLNAHGWTASGIESTGEMRRLGRWVEVPGRDDGDGYSTFVVAERV